MLHRKLLELMVGFFMLAGLVALVLLAFKVSGLSSFGNGKNVYLLKAEFDNIGGLKVRAPVSVAGVRIGEVKKIDLDTNNFRAVVTFQINNSVNTLPTDTSASILTQGILGSNYVGLTPGFEQKNLVNGDRIETTHPALILENLIGDLIYSLKEGGHPPATETPNENK